MAEFQVITSEYVNFNITKSDSENAPPVERRYHKSLTVGDLKQKLELVTGGSANTMKLKLYDLKDTYICDLDNESKMIGSYPLDNMCRLHVVDNFALTKDFTSTDSAERFMLSEEEYQNKGDTLRAFLQKNKLGKYNEEEMRQIKIQQEEDANNEAKLSEKIKVGDRCEVRVPKQAARRATIMYVGTLDGKPNIWIGVKYDEPLGKNDGSVDGKRYFTCFPKYGGFVKPSYVVVGDYPEEVVDLEDEI